MNQEITSGGSGFPALTCDGWDYHWPGESEIAAGEELSARLKMQLRPILRALVVKKQLPNGHVIVGAFYPAAPNRGARRRAEATGAKLAIVVSFLAAPQGVALPSSAIERVEELFAMAEVPREGLRDGDYQALVRAVGIDVKTPT